MVVIGIDDTDSRTRGMCTTWIATEIAQRLPPATVAELLLVRLHPAIEHKTRGNGAIAIRTKTDIETAFNTATTVVAEWAALEDPETNPGVVAVENRTAKAQDVRTIARRAVRTTLDRETVINTLERHEIRAESWGNGRGLIGATAAVGASASRGGDPEFPFRDWTYERLAYRAPDRWGTPRDVNGSVDEVSTNGAGVWDTIDPVTGELVCVPNSPCPVLFGIRGDRPDAVRRVAERLGGEARERTSLFVTNQGTDAHLRSGRIGGLRDGHGYRIRGTVIDSPAIKEGGHTRVSIERDDEQVNCMAFSPTGRFRTHVHGLIPGDEILACGEFSEGSLKLEKFALVEPALSKRVTPICPGCGRTMKSAGRNQGYRCRDCKTNRADKALVAIDRELDVGWYEVPPGARRHLAAPLIRGQYTLPVHPTSG